MHFSARLASLTEDCQRERVAAAGLCLTVVRFHVVGGVRSDMRPALRVLLGVKMPNGLAIAAAHITLSSDAVCKKRETSSVKLDRFPKTVQLCRDHVNHMKIYIFFFVIRTECTTVSAQIYASYFYR